MSAAVPAGAEARAGFKPRDVEELVDLYLHRPLAALLVRMLLPLPITPNQVTVASGVVSVVAGIFMGLAAFGSRWLMAVGGAVQLLSVLLDCADGQLARLRGQCSVFGRLLDGIMDGFAVFAVFHGMAFFLLGEGYGYVPIWSIGWLAVLSFIWHAAQYDAEKNIYLSCARPGFGLGGSTLLAVQDVERLRDELRGRGERLKAASMDLAVSWTRAQTKSLAPWRGELAPRSDAERALFRQIFRGPMRGWTFVGFGTHIFLLVAAALVATVEPRAIWAAWLLMAGPMNLWFAWLVWRRPRLRRRYAQELAALRQAAG
ncbi:MAG: CDP-alcohol phosphatidyltransferase family protein [Deltaproteobacteria bacterium]|nr:CDP-alcohol phosphatidyltransferase family protein [Deltaproteobacteria bacterium]